MEWRAIETAPVLEVVLLYVPSDGPRTGYFDLESWISDCGAWDYEHDPTHWMPLPEPPNGCGI